MDEPTIGPLLRALREQTGRSQSEQACVLSRLAGRVVTRNEVSRWETERRLLTPFWQDHCAASFDVPVSTLWNAVAAAKARRRRDQNEDPVQRRRFLGVMTGFALPVGEPDLPWGRVGAADVEQLYRHTARLRRLDDILGGADTYRTYAALAASTERVLTDAQFTEADGQRLRSVLGEQHQLAGWAAFDAGDHAKARRHYTASLAAAEAAGDVPLIGCGLGLLAYQETLTAQYGAATAQASYDMAGKIATPRVAALLLDRKAWRTP